MSRWPRAAALLAAVPCALTAQIDYRNLDDDRPTRVEDAYPVERYGLELLFPYTLERGRGGETLHAWTLEAAYGVLPNAHVGIKAPLTDRGLAGIRAFALFNLDNERLVLPALSLRADVHVATGDAGGDETRVALKGIATRSWGRTRLHVNAAYGAGRDGMLPAVEPLDRWWYGAALDRTLFRQSVLLLGEVYARRTTEAEPVQVNASLGLRWQWRPTVVLDAGLARRLRDAGPDVGLTLGITKVLGVRGSGLGPRGGPSGRGAGPEPRAPGPEPRHEQFYHPGPFNWSFLRHYPAAARLFNAFDYGHAVLYERLYTLPDSLRLARSLEREYRYLTADLLVRPPRYAVAEEAIEPTYAKLAWRAKLVFDWAHLLHRQIYDVYADERLSDSARIALVERLTDHYLARAGVALAPVPKAMELMDEQYYSQVFRRRHPKFNGLIWAYHWLQVGLYEPLIAGRTPAEKQAGVRAAVARFWDMLAEPPGSMPSVMPMTPAIAPRFTERHPRAAAVFDNLHMLHDVISDVLAADTVPRHSKRDVIFAALAEFGDTTRNVMTPDDWRHMVHHMGGIETMGGPVPPAAPR